MFGLDPWQFWTIIAITVASGFVKGVIGFAMPMVMMSGFSSILPASTALACVILPVLITNIQQAFRQGVGEAVATVSRYRLHISMVLLFVILSAGFATALPQAIMYALLGVPIALYALWQLTGRSMVLPVHHQRRLAVVTGMVGGFYGGISGIWGPPLVVYLLSIGADKHEQLRVQGVVFLLGAAMLTVAHLFSGVLNAHTLPLSALLCLPAIGGMMLGFALQDRLDVVQFRRWTLILLFLTGLNLVRKAVSLWM